MNLYQINAQIAELENAVDDGLLIDEETGELLTMEQALDMIKMERSQKIENIALWCKNLASDVAKIKAEEDNLSERRKATEKKIESLKRYLMGALMHEDGTAEKFRTALTTVSVRKNAPSVIISDEALLPKEFKIQKIEIKPDKSSIKEVLQRGIEVPGAHLESTRSVIIK